MDYALLSMTSRIAIDYRMRGENSSVDENLMNLFEFFVCGRIFHDFILNFRLWTKILLSFTMDEGPFPMRDGVRHLSVWTLEEYLLEEYL